MKTKRKLKSSEIQKCCQKKLNDNKNEKKNTLKIIINYYELNKLNY